MPKPNARISQQQTETTSSSPTSEMLGAKLQSAASAVLKAAQLLDNGSPAAPTACARAETELAFLTSSLAAVKAAARDRVAHDRGDRRSAMPSQDRISIH